MGQLSVGIFYIVVRRRIAIAAKPRPTRAMLAGSGTVLPIGLPPTSASTNANPVSTEVSPTLATPNSR